MLRSRAVLPLLLLCSFASLSCDSNAPVATSGSHAEDVALTSPTPRSAAAPARGSFVSAGPTADIPLPQAVDSTSGPMLIKTGQASLQVDSLERAVSALRDLARAAGGYVVGTTMQTGAHQVRSATLDLRIPSARFDQARSGLDAIGKVESVQIAAQDVGEEYVDVAARLENARRLESRLLDLLAQRTGKLQDVLSVERELARVREEIERYEGRMRYLRTQVAMSTLSVTAHEPFPIIAGAPGGNVLAEAFRNAWRNFVRFTAWFIAALGVLIPVSALVGLGALVWLAIRHRLPARRDASPTVRIPSAGERSS